MQVLSDIPCDPSDQESIDLGCTALPGDPEKGLIYNRPQVVQSYHDEWYVTGATVTEDQGVKTAIAFEDPALDPNLHRDDALVAALFRPGRGVPRLCHRMSVDDIKTRFNHPTNAGVPEVQRWGLDNIIRVERDGGMIIRTQDMAVRT